MSEKGFIQAQSDFEVFNMLMLSASSLRIVSFPPAQAAEEVQRSNLSYPAKSYVSLKN